MTSTGPLTIGTAGHVDHGKTALVHALTGVDTDRLPEERERGLTIVLGYAPLVLASGRRLSVVDVPGHERFVRTMVSGATGIDGFLLVVAADDGVMPQTVEHAAVLSGLGVSEGVVAVTKADLADPARAVAEAAELVPGCEVVAVSVRSQTGVVELRAALDRLARRLKSRAHATAVPPRLHVDRVFTVAGRGTVVTGTLWTGALHVGDALQLLPARTPVRVRGLEIHGAAHERAGAGQRVAVNLVGVRPAEVARGDVLAAPGGLDATTVLDCALELRGARHGENVHVHHGTREAPGRLVALGDDLWQVRLDRPLLAVDGDRVVVRRSSPAGTLGGGVVLDAAALRHGKRPGVLAALARRRDGVPDPPPSLERAGPPGGGERAGGGVPDLGASASVAGVAGAPGIPARAEGNRTAGAADVPAGAAAARAAGTPGVPAGGAAAPAAGASNPPDRAPSAPAAAAPAGLDPAAEQAALALEARLLAAGPAMLSEAQIGDAGGPLRTLRADGRAVRISGRHYAHAAVARAVRETALALIDRDGAVTLAGLRDELGASRRVAQAFLEHLDAERVTRRLPDDRRVRHRRPSGALA